MAGGAYLVLHRGLRGVCSRLCRRRDVPVPGAPTKNAASGIDLLSATANQRVDRRELASFVAWVYIVYDRERDWVLDRDGHRLEESELGNPGLVPLWGHLSCPGAARDGGKMDCGVIYCRIQPAPRYLLGNTVYRREAVVVEK